MPPAAPPPPKSACPRCGYDIAVTDAASCPECGVRLDVGYVGGWTIDSRKLFQRATTLIITYFSIRLVLLLSLHDIAYRLATGHIHGWGDIAEVVYGQYYFPTAWHVIGFVNSFVFSIVVIAAGIWLKLRANRPPMDHSVKGHECRSSWKRLGLLALFALSELVIVVVTESVLVVTYHSP